MDAASPSISIVTVEHRPDLWSKLIDPAHPLVQMIGAQMGGLYSETVTQVYHRLGEFPEFCKYILAAVHVNDQTGDEEVVGCAKAVPFYWPELATEQQGRTDRTPGRATLETLPDGGFSTIMAIARAQCLLRRGSSDDVRSVTEDQAKNWATATSTKAPNCLSALEIAVLPKWRSEGLAVSLMHEMRKAARDDGFPLLVVPARPTRKEFFPNVEMEEYVSWRFKENDQLPFDPWLRKHVREGGRLIKVAPCSEILEGDVSQWKDLTNQDMAEEAIKMAKSGEGKVELLFPGCFNPMTWDIAKGWGRYIEPNVWLYHVT